MLLVLKIRHLDTDKHWYIHILLTMSLMSMKTILLMSLETLLSERCMYSSDAIYMLGSYLHTSLRGRL